MKYKTPSCIEPVSRDPGGPVRKQEVLSSTALSSGFRGMIPAAVILVAIAAGGIFLHGTGAAAMDGTVQESSAQPPPVPVQPPQPVGFSGAEPDAALGRLEDEVLENHLPRPPDQAPVDVSQAAVDPTPQIIGGAEPPAPDAAVLPPLPAPVEVPPVSVPMPDAAVLEKTMPPVMPPVEALLPEPINGNSTVSEIKPPTGGKNQPDAYYDSHLNVPSGPLADTVGPRKVDPVQEPGSKFVIARKVYDGTDVEAQLVAATRALDLGRYESALELFDTLYKRNDRDARIVMGRAIAQQHLNMDDRAIMSYEEVLKIAPDNTDAVVNMMGLIQKQYPEIALRRLTDLQAQYPGNPGIAAQIGMAYAGLGKNTEALRALGMAASLEPTNASHVYNLAVVSDRMGEKQQAINYYERALEADAVYGNGRSIPRESIYDRLARLRQN